MCLDSWTRPVEIIWTDSPVERVRSVHSLDHVGPEVVITPPHIICTVQLDDEHDTVEFLEFKSPDERLNDGGTFLGKPPKHEGIEDDGSTAERYQHTGVFR